MMYRIGGRLRSWDASLDGAVVGIPPFVYWNSNSRSNDPEDRVRWAV